MLVSSLLLTGQKDLLWRVYCAATEPPGKVMPNADLVNFFLFHSLHIHEMAKSAILLMENHGPYAVVLVSRSALESAFNLLAGVRNKEFGPQRMAYELEDLARKLERLTAKGIWPVSRHPTPMECRTKAEWIRKEYNAPKPVKGDLDKIKKIEEIARTADLSIFYDDDYGQLSLTVHANQAGILNAATGFLARKAMVALCHSTIYACYVLCGVHGLKEFDAELKEHAMRLAELTKKPDFLPPVGSVFN